MVGEKLVKYRGNYEKLTSYKEHSLACTGK